MGALFSVHNGELLISMSKLNCIVTYLRAVGGYPRSPVAILVESNTLSVMGSTRGPLDTVSLSSCLRFVVVSKLVTCISPGAGSDLGGHDAHESETEFDDFRSHHRSTANG